MEERLELRFMILWDFPVFLDRKDIHMHKKTLLYIILTMDFFICIDF